MTAEAVRQEITDEDWVAVREAVELFVETVALAWSDPEFSVSSPANPFRSDRWKLSTTALEEPPATRLPTIGFPIRGIAGTKVEITPRDAVVSVGDAVRSAAGDYLGHETAHAAVVRQAQDYLRYAVGHSKPLLRAIRLYAYGSDGASKLEEVEEMPTRIFPAYFLEASRIEILIASVLEHRGVTANNLSALRFEDAHAVADDTVAALRNALNVTHFGFAVIALLNGPPIDQKEWVAFAGNWYDRPFRVVVGYPSDALCSNVISRVGHENALFIPDHLGALNCYVRLEYEVPVSISSAEMTAVNLAAGEYVRRAVDVLRLLHKDDIGIVYLAGFSAADAYEERTPLAPPFSEYFPERPNMMYRTPMRRIFDAPSGAPLAPDRLERFGELFDTWGLKEPPISGLPTAMERLRGIYDRYSPEEVGRLVDAVTGLEALYLPDGSTAELKYRLVTRAAWFLAPRAEDINLRTTVARELGEIYDARSSLVHTGQLKTKQKKRDRQLADRAITLLRITLLQFLSTQFGSGAKDLSERWLLVTMGESTLKPVDVPPAAPPMVEGPETPTAPPATSALTHQPEQESK